MRALDGHLIPSGRSGELAPVSGHRPDTVSLFSGMGGLDLAARIAGLKVGVATDRDAGALDVLHSALGTRTLVADCRECNGEQLSRAMPRSATIRYVIGGPPCTAFSHAGFW